VVEAIESVQQQTHKEIEIVVVVDGNRELYEAIEADFIDFDEVTIYLNEENFGNLQSVNVGIELATGEIIANMDDDATAAPDWIEQLVAAYREHDAFAAGGPIEPDWVDGMARFIPEEFFWLVGVTHKGVPDEPGEVRNTFGSNLSFRSDILEELGGYPTDDTVETPVSRPARLNCALDYIESMVAAYTTYQRRSCITKSSPTAPT